MNKQENKKAIKTAAEQWVNLVLTNLFAIKKCPSVTNNYKKTYGSK